MSSDDLKSASGGSSTATTPTRRKHFTINLGGRLRKALHTNDKHAKDSANQSKEGGYKSTKQSTKKNSAGLQPPQLTLNDAKIALSSRESCEHDPVSDPPVSFDRNDIAVDSLLNYPFNNMKLKQKGPKLKKDKNSLNPHYLTVENISGVNRKRSRSINIDDRLAQYPNQFLDPRNCFRSKEDLLKTLSKVRSNQGRSHEEIRTFLRNHKQSPLKKFFFSTLLEGHRCENLVTSSSKVIILDSKLSISKAFLALFHNNLRAAPVWNSESMCYDGMMTVTDFIHALLDRHQMALDVNFEKFSKIKIGNLKKVSQVLIIMKICL